MRKTLVLMVAGFMIAGTAQAAHARSSSVTISASRSTVELGQSVKLTGKVSPSAKKKRVKIQRRYEGGGWKTIKTVKLSSRSRYAYTVTPTRGGPTDYRVQKPGSKGRSTTTSATRRVDVFRWRSLLDFPVTTPYTLVQGTRTIGGQTFPASAALRGSDATWTIGGGRCTTFRTSIGIDGTSSAGVAASPNQWWNNGLPGQVQFQNNGQNADLQAFQNPRSFTEPVPAGISTYRLYPLSNGLGANDFVTLGTPQLRCNS